MSSKLDDLYHFFIDSDANDKRHFKQQIKSLMLELIEQQVFDHCYFDQEYKDRGTTIPVDELRQKINDL